jgi:hypothetical protein
VPGLFFARACVRVIAGSYPPPIIADYLFHCAGHDLVDGFSMRVADRARYAVSLRRAYRSALRTLAPPLARAARHRRESPPFYCLQRTTIDRFFTFAPKIPPTVPPEVAPLSTSFDTTS